MRFEWKHRVEWGECDPARIVFYPHVYRWFDKSSQDLLEFHGYGQAEMIEQHGIVGFPLIETHAEFKSPMRWNDELTVASSIDSHSRKTFTVTHKILNADNLCVQGYEIRCWGQRDERTGAMRALEIPAEFSLKIHQSTD